MDLAYREDRPVFWFAVTAFIISSGVLAYTHMGYPLLALTLAKWMGRPHRAIALASDDELPRISVLIAAYNAEASIERRLTNLFDTDFPLDRMEVIVATDGCTDQTARLARLAGFPRVKVIEFAQRRGKTSTLVSSMPAVNHEVVVFTDATTTFEKRTLRLLAQRFVDPEVGIVTGRVEMVDNHQRSAEGFYWRLESQLREAEAALDALVGASGAVYAIRRQSFVPPTTTQLNDDLVLPMLSRMRTRLKFILEPKAVAQVIAPASLKGDYQRRVRVGTGAFQSFRELRGLLHPRQGRIAISFFSHKVLRWLSPLFLLSAFVSNALLWQVPVFRIALLTQGVCYGVALLGLLVPGQSTVARRMRIATSFAVVNIAFAVGFVNWLRNRNKATWEPTVRPLESPQPYARTIRNPSSRSRLSGRVGRRIG